MNRLYQFIRLEKPSFQERIDPIDLLRVVVGRTTTVGVVQGHFPALPEGLVAVQALRERPVGLVRSLLQIRQTLGSGDVDVEVLDVDVDLVRRRGQRLSSPDCPG